MTLRSILAVLAGYATFAASAVALFALSERDPHAPASTAFTAVSIAWGAFFGMAAGWLAGRIAGYRHLLHAGIVGLLIALGATVSMIAHPGEGALWTQLASLFLFAPLTLLGGYYSAARQR